MPVHNISMSMSGLNQTLPSMMSGMIPLEEVSNDNAISMPRELQHSKGLYSRKSQNRPSVQGLFQMPPQFQSRMASCGPTIDPKQLHIQTHTQHLPENIPTEPQGPSHVQPEHQSGVASYGLAIGFGQSYTHLHTQPSQQAQMELQGYSQVQPLDQFQTLGNISQQPFPQMSPPHYSQVQAHLSATSQLSSLINPAPSYMQSQVQSRFELDTVRPEGYCSLSLYMISYVLGSIPPWINNLPKHVTIPQQSFLSLPQLNMYYPSFYFLLDVYTSDYRVKGLPSYFEMDLVSIMGPDPKLHRVSYPDTWLKYWYSFNMFIAIHGGRHAVKPFTLVEFVKGMARLNYIDSASICISMTQAYESFRISSPLAMDNLFDFALRLSYINVLSNEQLETGFPAHKRSMSRKRRT